jgi:hypothetical protein
VAEEVGLISALIGAGFKPLDMDIPPSLIALADDSSTVRAAACRRATKRTTCREYESRRLASGIVAKRRDRPYRSGRSPDWIKVKNPDAPAAIRVIE